jgi:hypothetical protein
VGFKTNSDATLCINENGSKDTDETAAAKALAAAILAQKKAVRQLKKAKKKAKRKAKKKKKAVAQAKRCCQTGDTAVLVYDAFYVAHPRHDGAGNDGQGYEETNFAFDRPAEALLGAPATITGWNQQVPGMCVGDRKTLQLTVAEAGSHLKAFHEDPYSVPPHLRFIKYEMKLVNVVKGDAKRLASSCPRGHRFSWLLAACEKCDERTVSSHRKAWEAEAAAPTPAPDAVVAKAPNSLFQPFAGQHECYTCKAGKVSNEEATACVRPDLCTRRAKIGDVVEVRVQGQYITTSDSKNGWHTVQGEQPVLKLLLGDPQSTMHTLSMRRLVNSLVGQCPGFEVR